MSSLLKSTAKNFEELLIGRHVKQGFEVLEAQLVGIPLLGTAQHTLCQVKFLGLKPKIISVASNVKICGPVTQYIIGQKEDLNILHFCNSHALKTQRQKEK